MGRRLSYRYAGKFGLGRDRGYFERADQRRITIIRTSNTVFGLVALCTVVALIGKALGLLRVFPWWGFSLCVAPLALCLWVQSVLPPRVFGFTWKAAQGDINGRCPLCKRPLLPSPNVKFAAGFAQLAIQMATQAARHGQPPRETLAAFGLLTTDDSMGKVLARRTLETVLTEDEMNTAIVGGICLKHLRNRIPSKELAALSLDSYEVEQCELWWCRECRIGFCGQCALEAAKAGGATLAKVCPECLSRAYAVTT